MSGKRPGVAEANRRRARPIMVRFWERVNKDGPVHPIHGQCWLWTGRNCWGYGYIQINGINTRAHRFSYEFLVGAIPEGMLVCHHCDMTMCVRPEHLFLGTDATNSDDKVAKGRASHLKGEDNGNSKLTDEQVRYIRTVYVRYSRKFGAGALAKEFGVSDVTILGIVNWSLWKHVKLDGSCQSCGNGEQLYLFDRV